MGHIVIHHEGVFNVWSTVVDAPILEHGVTRAQLFEWSEDFYTPRCNHDFDWRADKAVQQGTSSLLGENLDELIVGNRAGPNEKSLSKAEFIKQYLTLPTVEIEL